MRSEKREEKSESEPETILVYLRLTCIINNFKYML